MSFRRPRWMVCVWCVLHASLSVGQTMTAELAQSAVRDMVRPHAALPSGAYIYDWGQQARVGYGSDAPDGWSAMTAWGQVYKPTTGNPSTNTRVQLGNLTTWVQFRSTGQWSRLQQTSQIGGALYREDFAGDVNTPTTLRQETQGWSVLLPSDQPVNFHFWPAASRLSFDLSDIQEMVVSIDARLIINNATLPDDRASARLMLSTGADYWLNQNAAWDNFRTNGDVGIGRFKFITNQWQSFHMTTLTYDDLRQQGLLVIPEPGLALWCAVGLGLLRRRPPAVSRTLPQQQQA